MSTRDQLAGVVRDQAVWREQKAREYPDDERNVRSAVALHALREWISALDANDPRLSRLAQLSDQLAVEVSDLCHGDESGRWISRYQFDQYHSISEDDWLTGLVGRVAEEAGKRRWDDLGPAAGPAPDGVGPRELAERVARAAERLTRWANELAGIPESEVSDIDRRWLWVADDRLTRVLAERGRKHHPVG